ncbi:MAG: MBL fold metallo-hydrolase [Candidatus Bathyarchaeota archaeon]|nr:MBL fold metallo-hydrolase [Candidatus Bathyarchaeota archaeon]
MKLYENLYWYEYKGFKNNCNAILIKNDSHLLIDPGHIFNFENLFQEIKRDGIDSKEIITILNTHCHPDHCESNEILQKISRGKIGMHEIEYDYYKNDARLLYEMFNMPFQDSKVDFYLKDSIEHNGLKLEIIHTPGHSPGSVCFYWRKQRVLISGDLIFENSFGRSDLPGGNPSLLQTSVKNISNLDIELLLPGHGKMVDGKKNIQKNFDFINRILKNYP